MTRLGACGGPRLEDAEAVRLSLRRDGACGFLVEPDVDGPQPRLECRVGEGAWGSLVPQRRLVEDGLGLGVKPTGIEADGDFEGQSAQGLPAERAAGRLYDWIVGGGDEVGGSRSGHGRGQGDGGTQT